MGESGDNSLISKLRASGSSLIDRLKSVRYDEGNPGFQQQAPQVAEGVFQTLKAAPKAVNSVLDAPGNAVREYGTSKGYNPALVGFAGLAADIASPGPGELNFMKKGLSKIPKELETLAQEARKYKSAEEFVKAQVPVYHGSPVPLKKFLNKKGGVFFTDSMEDASGFAGSPDNIYEGYLNFKKPLVIDAKGRKWDDLKTKWGRTTQEVVSNARKEGYDGVTFKNIIDNVMDDADSGVPGTIHFAHEPETAFINESQLTDLWNKAKGEIKVKDPRAGGIKTIGLGLGIGAGLVAAGIAGTVGKKALEQSKQDRTFQEIAGDIGKAKTIQEMHKIYKGLETIKDEQRKIELMKAWGEKFSKLSGDN